MTMTMIEACVLAGVPHAANNQKLVKEWATKRRAQFKRQTEAARKFNVHHALVPEDACIDDRRDAVERYVRGWMGANCLAWVDIAWPEPFDAPEDEED